MRNLFFVVAFFIILWIVLEIFHVIPTWRMMPKPQPILTSPEPGKNISSLNLNEDKQIADVTYLRPKSTPAGMFFVPQKKVAVTRHVPNFYGKEYERSQMAETGGAFTSNTYNTVTQEEKLAQYTNVFPAFFMDNEPITNQQYQKFITASHHQVPPNWKKGIIPEGEEERFVVDVTLDDAKAYAVWAGKRLPTQDEYLQAQKNNLHFRQGVDVNEWTTTIKNIDTNISKYIIIGGESMAANAYNDYTGFRCVLDINPEAYHENSSTYTY